MNVLICCEHFLPDGGGVAKVLGEVALGLNARGHKVTVATSFSKKRKNLFSKSIAIREFNCFGNWVSGLKGDIEEYRNFVCESKFDVLLVKAAQQWSFDALLDVLDDIPYPVVHIPTGYSGFNTVAWKQYYQKMESWLKKINHLIYYASEYRDIQFAKKLGLKNWTLIPNGASLIECSKKTLDVKKKLGISKNEKVLLTVGSPPIEKGHLFCLQAINCTPVAESPTLVLIGDNESLFPNISALKKWKLYLYRAPKLLWLRLYAKVLKIRGYKIIRPHLNREETISLFQEADLFVFASAIEYSPLVLFEASAVGTPYITTDVGNSAEITFWTNGGINLPAQNKIHPKYFSRKILELLSNEKQMRIFANNGRNAIEQKYNWDKIVLKYEFVLQSVIHDKK